MVHRNFKFIVMIVQQIVYHRHILGKFVDFFVFRLFILKYSYLILVSINWISQLMKATINYVKCYWLPFGNVRDLDLLRRLTSSDSLSPLFVILFCFFFFFFQFIRLYIYICSRFFSSSFLYVIRTDIRTFTHLSSFFCWLALTNVRLIDSELSFFAGHFLFFFFF